MRVIVVNSKTDAQTLTSRLSRDLPGQQFEAIEKLNPHVDFSRVEPGTVILVPDPPSAAAGQDTRDRSIQGKAFDDLRDLVGDGFETSSARVRRGYDELAAEAKDITAALKSAPIKRATEADPELKQQVEAAAAVFKQDTADAKAADQTLKSIKQKMDEELDALSKLLG
jgi:hypothetical protein